MIKLKAYAKVNLGLDIIGRRENGYHDVRMIMQSVDLFDVLTFEKTENKQILIETESKEIPVNQDNLIYKACDMLIKEFDIKEGVKITLEKNIPVAAGMAGGSTDCAAALKGMNMLFSLGLSEKELMERGVKLGADVPYCIMGGTAVAEGIGEILTPLPESPKCIYLIVKPPVSVSTKTVYEKFDEIEKSRLNHPDIDGLISAVNESNLNKLSECMGNILEQVTVFMHPEIQNIKDMMLAYGALNSLMSGSGPTVFGIYDDLEKVWQTALEIEKTGHAGDVFIVGGV